MKVSLEEVEAKLLENRIAPNQVQTIIRQLTEVVEEIKAEKDSEAGPKQKWEYVIVLNDPENILAGREIAGWVVQQEADADAGTILGKIADTVRTQNETAKRKRNFITDLTSAFEYLKPKFLKEKKVRIKTKDLTRVLVTNGRL